MGKKYGNKKSGRTDKLIHENNMNVKSGGNEMKSFWYSFNYVPFIDPLENIQTAVVHRHFGNTLETFGWKNN